MSLTTLVVLLLVFFSGVLGSALFSGTETGIYVLNRVRLKLRAERGDKRANILQKEINRGPVLLVTLLIGTNLMTHITSFAVTSFFSLLHIGQWQEILITALVLTPVLFIFAETLPKDLFRSHGDRWVYPLARFLVFSRRILTISGLSPVVILFSNLFSRLFIAEGEGLEVSGQRAARQEMAALLKEGVGSGVLSESQTTLLDRALALRNISVASEMVPWPSVVHVSVRLTTSEITRRADYLRFTRLPAVDTAGKVSGIINTLDCLLNPEEPVEKHLMKPLFLPPHLSVRDALEKMWSGKAAMAIVQRPGGRPVGLVTLKDLVEPLIGELQAW